MAAGRRVSALRILVVCPHFDPDAAAPTGVVMTRIALELAERGHQLHVVTSLPWYREHAIEPGWGGKLVRHEATPWGRITRLHPFPTDKTNIPARALGFAGFTAEALAFAAATPHRPDVVMAMSPPLTLGPAGWAAARARRAPMVFNIQDVFPDAAVETGTLTNPKVIAAAARVERWSYQLADAVTVLSDDLRDNVVAKLEGRRRGSAAKVRVIPNFVDTSLITPGPTDTAYRRELGLVGKQVVLYAGNVGLSQSFDLLVEAARRNLERRPDVAFLVNGGGSALVGLREATAALPNVHFGGFQPPERLADLLATGDVHLVLLKRGLAKASVPSKLYSILAAGRPVLAAVDEGTEVARTVAAAGAGVAVPPDDTDAFCAALDRLLDDPGGARAMGERGRRFVESWASPAAVAERYESLFEELRGDRAAFRGRGRSR
jgi:colanic acid biosynthesis glycosyl transferase WcaI